MEYLNIALANHAEILVKKSADGKEDTYEDHSNLWAVVCLVLASKYDEIDRRIPYYRQVMAVSKRAAIYTLKEFHQVEEFFVLCILNWNFRVLTTLHFTHSLVCQGILFEDDRYPSAQEDILQVLQRKAELLTDLSLDSSGLAAEYS